MTAQEVLDKLESTLKELRRSAIADSSYYRSTGDFYRSYLADGMCGGLDRMKFEIISLRQDLAQQQSKGQEDAN